MTINPIAVFHSPFTSKFGIPKQSGLVADLQGRIVFEPSFRNADFVRGLEDFDYIWLIWGFSANRHEAVCPVVRPPVLGGNEKMGVFATRSPFRPNPLGLSSVRIERIEHSESLGPVIHVLGADLMDGTPIFDIKPYISYADSHADVRCGFVDHRQWPKLSVVFPDFVEKIFSAAEIEVLRQTLSLDPRPHYQNDPQKVYGMPFAGRDVRFRVADRVLTVVEVTEKHFS
ncbi:MAG: tRNA (N6-threonylcarbamoyladenosine(37)-N6)-methyltransferase TrmO [Prevotella sp.]|nr:tRNA (N6-threonylcarbamoyladenosine(37)-N6)-methyltransferase TrmO [Prevotella sp.]